MTKGNTNSRTKLWTPRIKNNTELTRQINSIKGNLTAAQVNAIKQNINLAAKNRKIGYFRTGLLDVVDANLKNRVGQAKWLVNMGLGPQPSPQAPWRAASQRNNAARKIGKAWIHRTVKKNIAGATRAQLATTRSMQPGGATRRAALLGAASTP